MIDKKQYSKRLINKIFKYLPLIEEDRENAKKYLKSLIVELEGSLQYFEDDYYLQDILFSLNGLQNVTDHNVVRSKIFECINLVNKILKDGGEG
jgi:hypothetical protein